MSKTSNKRKYDFIENKPKRPICVFCRTDTKNKYYLGKMMEREDQRTGRLISAHYYCILLSPALQQNGHIREGFKGFLTEDINAEVSRGRPLKCSYCRRNGAVIGCALNSCTVKFHLTCGLVNDSFHAFHEESKSFPSFCSTHRRNQRVPRIGSKESGDDYVCVVCSEAVDQNPKPSTLWSPCCGQWLHRECVIKLAYHSGKHHLKCPKCNNREKFVDEMKRFGVNVPSRDASWEKGHNFDDLYTKSYKCTAVKCLSKKGRDYNGDEEWEILACDACGANGIHIKCGQLALNSEEWMCDVCTQAVKPKDNKKLKVLNN